MNSKSSLSRDHRRTVRDREYCAQVKQDLKQTFGAGFLRNMALDCFIGARGRDIESQVMPMSQVKR